MSDEPEITPIPLPFIDDGLAYERAVPAHRVYIRDAWEDDWELVPYLYAEQVVQATSPDIGTASLVYRFGQVARPDGNYGIYEVLPISESRRPYVKIQIDDPGAGLDNGQPIPIEWYGLIISQVLEQDGSLGQLSPELGHEDDPPSRIASGRQHFHAVSFEWLLERQMIRYSVARVPAGAADEDAGEVKVGRAITFNAGGGDNQQGLSGVRRNNQDPEPGTTGAPIFAGLLDKTALPWTASEILSYLLAYFSPADAQGHQTLAFNATGTLDQLKWHEPIVAAEGKTLKGLIDQIIDRRRLSGWFVDFSASEEPQIRVFTFNHETIYFDDVLPDPDAPLEDGEPLPPAEAVPANPNQFIFDSDRRLDVAGVVTTLDSSPRYDRVIVRGERRGCCFTIGKGLVEGETATLEADWSDDMLTAYNAAATAEDGYSDGDEYTKMDRNMAARKSHALKRVFSYFRLPLDWDGTDYGAQKVCPPLPGQENEPAAGQLWRAGLRLENTLPLLLDRDYSGELTTEDKIPDTTPDGGAPEFLPPIVGIRKTDGGGRWHHLDQVGASTELDPLQDVGEQPWAASVRMQTEGLGFVIKVEGRPQHVLGKGEFAAADAADEKDWPADLDWRDGLFATVFMYSDEHLVCPYPATMDNIDDDVAETLTIDVGASGRLDFMPKGTVWKISGGEVSQTANDFYLRDDRPRLTRLAQVAHDWYQGTRRAVDIQLRQITGAFLPGDMIAQLGGGETALEVNSVITRIEWDLVAGTTRVATQFAELDAAGFLNERSAKGNAR